MEEVKYFLIPEKETQSIERDFDQLIAFASKYEKTVPTGGYVTIELEKDGEKYPSRIESKKDHIVFTTTRTNDFTIENIRVAAYKIGYRTFSVDLGCFLPDHLSLRDLSTYKIDSSIEEIIIKAGYKPIFAFTFNSEGSAVYAKKHQGEEIYIINPYLLTYYKAYGYEHDNSTEFSYAVSPNLEKFAPMFDAGLIPIDFYQGYRKRDKIYNYSYFNVYNPGRKVFVKPLVFELENRTGKFYTRGSEKGAMILMDKIRPGETIHDTIMRFLKEYNLADGYIGAVVGRDIEIDRDREGKLTPRLIVSVYVERLKSMPKELKRSWVPIPEE